MCGGRFIGQVDWEMPGSLSDRVDSFNRLFMD